MTRNALMSIIYYETSIYYYFLNYWNATNNEFVDSGVLQDTYDKLNVIWIKNFWDIKELDFICEKINRGEQLLNPNVFVGKEN